MDLNSRAKHVLGASIRATPATEMYAPVKRAALPLAESLAKRPGSLGGCCVELQALVEPRMAGAERPVRRTGSLPPHSGLPDLHAQACIVTSANVSSGCPTRAAGNSSRLQCALP